MVLARLLRDLCIYIAVNLFLSSPTVVLVYFSQWYVDMVNLPFYIASCDNLWFTKLHKGETWNRQNKPNYGIWLILVVLMVFSVCCAGSFGCKPELCNNYFQETNHLLNHNLICIVVGDKTLVNCTGCKSRDTSAVARCFDCANFLCPNCVTAHKFMHCFEGHRVKSLEEIETAATEDGKHSFDFLDCGWWSIYFSISQYLWLRLHAFRSWVGKLLRQKAAILACVPMKAAV